LTGRIPLNQQLAFSKTTYCLRQYFFVEKHTLRAIVFTHFHSPFSSMKKGQKITAANILSAAASTHFVQFSELIRQSPDSNS
jgi:hypothetical protein